VTETKTLCMIPWLHRFTNEQGLHQLCGSGTGAANLPFGIKLCTGSVPFAPAKFGKNGARG
jgi:hypothetical protein